MCVYTGVHIILDSFSCQHEKPQVAQAHYESPEQHYPT